MFLMLYTFAGKSKLVDVVLTRHNIWAVDAAGNVFFHSGPQLLPNQQSTSCSWLALGSLSDQTSGTISWAGSALKHSGLTTYIVHIFASASCDWMVSSLVDVHCPYNYIFGLKHYFRCILILHFLSVLLVSFRPEMHKLNFYFNFMISFYSWNLKKVYALENNMVYIYSIWLCSVHVE